MPKEKTQKQAKKIKTYETMNEKFLSAQKKFKNKISYLCSLLTF